MNTVLDRIMQRLDVPNECDAGLLRADAEQKLAEGWTEHEIVAYLRCTEEVNPDLREGVALARMSAIRANVMRRMGRS